jgi:hypothetical protein
MEFMLKTCVETAKELLDVARRAKSGRSSFEFSWGAYARELFSLVVHDMLTYMDKAASHDRCLRNVRAEAVSRGAPESFGSFGESSFLGHFLDQGAAHFHRRGGRDSCGPEVTLEWPARPRA